MKKPITIAIIDDHKSYHEVIELNNSLKTLFDISVSVNDIMAETVFSELYPNPFTDEINLEYSLAAEYDEVQLMIYDLSGKACLGIADLPAYKGVHFVVRRFSELDKGLYLCRIVATGRNIETIIKTSKLIKE